MQPNGNVIVDTICRTAKLGTTITGATENGDVTVIEAEPVEPINECPTCGQPGVFRDHVIRSLGDLLIVGPPTTSCAPSTLPTTVGFTPSIPTRAKPYRLTARPQPERKIGQTITCFGHKKAPRHPRELVSGIPETSE